MYARLINVAVGIWLMVMPSVLAVNGTGKANSVICGALSASLAVIAIWEVMRGLRWVNLMIGCWLLLSAFVFNFQIAAVVSTFASGLVMIAMSLVRGRVTDSTGGGWSELFSRSN